MGVKVKKVKHQSKSPGGSRVKYISNPSYASEEKNNLQCENFEWQNSGSESPSYAERRWTSSFTGKKSSYRVGQKEYQLKDLQK